MADESNDRTPLRLLGVFAHPDDETFCAGGTFARYTAAGAEAMVVSATPGDAGQIRNARLATRRTLGKVRARELQSACEKLGIQHVQCLDYGDGKLEAVERYSLIRDVTRIIRSFRPDIVITFGHDGAYGHPDHIAIGAATDEAFFAAGDEERFPSQLGDDLAVHTPSRLYHSYFPRSNRLLLRQLSKWLGTMPKRFHGTPEFTHGLLLFADEASMLGYTSDHIAIGWYPAGFYIIEQGEPPVSLYMILSGQAEVYQEDDEGNTEKVNELGPGDFFGETGLAFDQPRNAHVTALDNVSCLVFSPGEPTHFAGRGQDAEYAFNPAIEGPAMGRSTATTCIDATAFIMQKMAAIGAHRTQYPITPDMFPRPLLEELLGKEYFVRVFPPIVMENDL